MCNEQTHFLLNITHSGISSSIYPVVYIIVYPKFFYLKKYHNNQNATKSLIYPCSACRCLTRRLKEQPDPEEKHNGHFARKGASASTREREEPEETETVPDL